MDAEVAERRQESQRKGIETAKKAGRHYGRPQTTFPENWDVVYSQWKAQDITADETAVKLGAFCAQKRRAFGNQPLDSSSDRYYGQYLHITLYGHYITYCESIAIFLLK